MRRVAHLPVEHDDVAACADRGQRLAEGQPGGDLGAQFIAGQAHLAVGPGPGGPGLRRQPDDRDLAFPAQLDDGPLSHVRGQRPAVPALAVLDLVEPAALAGAGQDHGGPVGFGRVAERFVDLAEVVPVDGDGVAAERLDPLGVRVQVPAELGGAALTEAVDVDDRGQLVQPVVGRLVERLPHRPLGHLAVAAQHPDVVWQLVEVPSGQGHADPVRQPLAEGAGGHVDPWQHRRGMALQPGAESPVPVHQLVVGDHADRLEHRVEQRGRVPLGEDQVVVGRIVRLLPVVAQVPGHQHRHHVGGGHARRRVAGSGGGAAPDRVDPQLLGQFVDIVQGVHGHAGLLQPSMMMGQGLPLSAATGRSSA